MLINAFDYRLGREWYRYSTSWLSKTPLRLSALRPERRQAL